jgi:hypothetical protein
MSEKKDFQLFKKAVTLTGLERIERIENVLAAGTPDVNFCIDGVDGWLEIKSAVEPKRETSKLLKHKLSQDQMNWFKRESNSGGRSYILICTDIRWILIDGRDADSINSMDVNELCGISIWTRCHPIPIGHRLRNVLKGGK